MKRAPKFIITFLVLLVAGCAGWAAARIGRLEQRLGEFQTAYSELLASHRTLVTAMLKGSPEQEQLAKLEVFHEAPPGFRLKDGKISLGDTEINAPPRAVGNKRLFVWRNIAPPPNAQASSGLEFRLQAAPMWFAP